MMFEILNPSLETCRLVTQMTKPINWYTGDVLLDADAERILESGLWSSASLDDSTHHFPPQNCSYFSMHLPPE